MEKAIKTRSVIRTTFSKLFTRLNELINEENINLEILNAEFKILMERYNQLVKLDADVFEYKVEKCTEEQLTEDLEKCDEYSAKFNKLHSTIEILNSKRTCSDKVISPKNTRKFKLPVLELTKFDGKLEDWLPFWSQFKKIDEDCEIADCDKILYLKQAVVPGSRVQDLVDSFPATGENYHKVIKCLKNRYGRDDLLIEVYVRQLLSIVIKNTASSDINLPILYDKLESKLRALETLGVTSEKCASMLLPLIESCLPEAVLRWWQRNNIFTQEKELSMSEQGTSTSKDRLDLLMKFIRAEVESDQKVALALHGFGIKESSNFNKTEKRTQKQLNKPTAAALLTTATTPENKCLFCQNKHISANCTKAAELSLAEREQILKDRGACFSCMKVGHLKRACKSPRPKCIVCGKDHHVLLCQRIKPINEDYEKKRQPFAKRNIKVTEEEKDSALANLSTANVSLQTLHVVVRGESCEKRVRALIDTGSQKSYLLDSIAEELKYKPIREEQACHQLFGGSCTNTQIHQIYRIYLSDLKNNYKCNFEVLSQPSICGNISGIKPGPWMEDLKKKNIRLTDFSDGQIHVLIGADVAGKLLTGRREILNCGLVAIETLLGWTIIGKVPATGPRENVAMMVTSLLTTQREISELWSLDSLGITDPTEKRTKTELHLEAVKHFNNTVRINSEKRYEVHMPWLESHPSLPSNFDISNKRLDSILKKLVNSEKFDAYNDAFREWEEDGIIERDYDTVSGHFLPHRPVYKENSTTKVRPVFDASAREKGRPSLNNCLEPGMNLIELIPSIMNRFRLNKIGLSADIRKAFLQISLAPSDRKFLKFLWVDKDYNKIIYRHCRVVFGVCCSPFLLGATIQHHLVTCKHEITQKRDNTTHWVIEKLLQGFYVDNCLTSVDNGKQAELFIQEATEIMRKGKFDLRGWESSTNSMDDLTKIVNVLGLQWNPYEDSLCVSTESLRKLEFTKVTKRVILSAAHRIFDPIGITCCVSLVPKIIVQQTWKDKIGWEQEVKEETKNQFMKWLRGLDSLSDIKIPRWLVGTDKPNKKSLHIFCDASQLAYAAVAFLRMESHSDVVVRMVQGKSRVAPIGKRNLKISIPRLELLAATIGARLYENILKGLELQELEVVFWTDSSTVLAWLQREETWDVFVRNRVDEIHKITLGLEWKHICGTLNPADLASRGCSAAALLKSKWWEGPQWLAEKGDNWRYSKSIKFDEEEINKEKKMTITSSMICSWEDNRICNYFSSYRSIVRLVGWILRFCENAKNPNKRINGVLSRKELETAEVKLLRMIQQEYFVDLNDKRLNKLRPLVDEEGIIRVETKISYRKDTLDFRRPIVIPDKNHPITSKLILEKHQEACHAGVQILMSILREHYWIIGGRRTVRSVLNKCLKCKRHSARPIDVLSPPLPVNRVRDALVFEVCGLDLAGPVYLKNDSKTNKKAWICIYTCAVYRAIHLELLTSMSTDRFLQCLRRFIRRRGRPKTIYCDNGRNFVGAANALNSLDWSKIENSSSVQKIDWKFIPPSAPWWGGWWERLIRILKQLLKRTLGKTSLDWEEMQSMLCDCEDVINSRPLTYLYESNTELTSLTPSMFLRDIEESGVPDLDSVGGKHLNKRLQYRRKLRTELNSRFRNEYLGQLILHSKRVNSHKLQVGDLVLIEHDNMNRIDWPLAIVEELIKGRDTEVRCVRLKTATGVLLRPIQRVCPLEVSADDVDKFSIDDQDVAPTDVQDVAPVDDQADAQGEVQETGLKEDPPITSTDRCTRSGRRVKIPARFAKV